MNRLEIAAHIAGHIYLSFQQDGMAKEHHNWREGVAIESLRIAELLIEIDNNRAWDPKPEVKEVDLPDNYTENYPGEYVGPIPEPEAEETE